jgi:hypothetical protein
LLAAIPAACGSPAFRKVSVEIPAVSPAGLESGHEIVVADFRELEAVPNVALGRRVAEYLEAELRREFKGKVSRRTEAGSRTSSSDDRDYWRSAGVGMTHAVFLVGSVSLREQSQKALRQDSLPTDGPFRLENRGLLERQRFILSLDCSLIDAGSGAVIMKKSLRETRNYGTVQTTPEFALSDFLPVVKAKLFAALFGRPSIQERNLLLR